MKKANNIKDVLNHLQVSEGERFTFEEEAILAEYQKDNSEKSGLTIKVLSIAGGFLATLAFLGFLFIAGLYDSEIGLFLFGIGFIAGAIWVNKIHTTLIIDTSSISVFVIGFILFGMGLSQIEVDENVICVLFILIAFASLSITQNYMLSFISVLIISGSFLTLITLNEFNLIHLYIIFITFSVTYWILEEATIITINKKVSKLYKPIRIGLVFSLIMGLGYVGKRGLFLMSEQYIWLSSIATISAILYILSIVLEKLNVKESRHKIMIYTASALLLALTAFSPAVSGALSIILLSFLVNYKTGFVIGILSFIYFLSQYYYDLHFTLLVKSAILFSTGILFLLFYVFTHKKLDTNEKI